MGSKRTNNKFRCWKIFIPTKIPFIGKCILHWNFYNKVFALTTIFFLLRSESKILYNYPPKSCSMKIIFCVPVNTDNTNFVAFFVFVCTTASFSLKFRLETRLHLGSGHKTVNNSQGYSELREPTIKTRENCYSNGS